MNQAINRQITMVARPEGAPKASDFKLLSSPVPAPAEGEVLCRTSYLSLDPYMRGRMSAAKSYSARLEIGDVMIGEAVSRVDSSRHPDFATGDTVVGGSGWQDYAVLPGTELRKVKTGTAPISTALGVLGMTGFTAWIGLLDIAKPKSGETLVVPAATGAVGAIVGQLGKLNGCRVVGVAGSAEKCDYAVKELGFDVCLNHHEDDFESQLFAACPNGVDIYFETVGGRVFAAVRDLLNDFARIPVCGLIAHYNATSLPEGPDQTAMLMRAVLVKRLMIKGFIIFDHNNRYPDFQREMSALVSEGKIKYREDVVDGLENAVSAFQGLLEGQNFGKLLVRMVAE